MFDNKNFMVRIKEYLLGLFVVLYGMVCVQASTYQEVITLAEQDVLKDKGYEYVVIDVNDKKLPLDSDLKYLGIEYGHTNQRITILVSTKGQQYKLTGRYNEAVELPIFTKTLNKSRKVDISNVELKKYDIKRNKDYYVQSIDEIKGKEAKIRISAGFPIKVVDLKDPDVVVKGERIKVEFSTNNLVVRILAEALKGGATGDTIKVKNVDSKKVIHAKIIKPGLVVVGD